MFIAKGKHNIIVLKIVLLKINIKNKNENKKKSFVSNQKFDPFQDLLDVSKKNENNIKKIMNK